MRDLRGQRVRRALGGDVVTLDSMGATDPDDIGSSEYRAIYECIDESISDLDSEDPRELAIQMLGEFIDHAITMREAIG